MLIQDILPPVGHVGKKTVKPRFARRKLTISL